ncbi:MAG: DUF2459 domain-containing protein [Bacteroidales bacterium]|nr:DUF2459 domain-containing protein [Bacteroidales bacterium]
MQIARKINKIGTLLVLFLFANGYKVKADETRCKNIFLVRQSWHAALVMPSHDLKNYLSKLPNHFFHYQYIEISWGDLDFFTASKPTVWQGIKAVLFPTNSVILVQAYNTHPSLIFPLGYVFEFKISENDYRLLLAYIEKSFKTDTNNSILHLSSSTCVPYSCFYHSVDKYHLFNTCNMWIARGLRKGGLDVCVWLSMFPKGLIKQTQKAQKKYKYNCGK